MTNVDITRTTEIITLHSQIGDYLKSSLLNAQRIGELLAEQKASIGHGAFGAWIKESLPFSDRTARNYLTLHKERARLKTENVSDLATAYRLLKQRALGSPGDQVQHYLDLLKPLMTELDGYFKRPLSPRDPDAELAIGATIAQAQYYTRLAGVHAEAIIRQGEETSDLISVQRVFADMERLWTGFTLNCERRLGQCLSEAAGGAQ